MKPYKDKVQKAATHLLNSLENFGQQSNTSASTSPNERAPRPTRTFSFQPTVYQIKMHGWSTNDSKKAFGAHGKRLEKHLFNEAFKESTGAVPEKFNRNSMVVTVVAETSAIEKRVEEELHSGGLLEEINERIAAYNDEENTSLRSFDSIEKLTAEKRRLEHQSYEGDTGKSHHKPELAWKMTTGSQPRGGGKPSTETPGTQHDPIDSKPPKKVKPPLPATKLKKKNLLPKHSKSSSAGKGSVNENDMASLLSMGYTESQVLDAAARTKSEPQNINAILDVLYEQDQSKLDHKAVQIVLPNQQQEEGYCLNEHEIERIFGHQAVANTPVAIYSLAGAFRKGKSFMLNFFLRYLWAVNNNKSDEWLKSKAEKLNKGFVWRGGSDRDTQGIWIWDEPFFVHTPQGKVALFLMDTQGSFDHKSTVKDCSVIFGLSTLLSSMLIYNVQSLIQENTLQYLQLFTKYAKLAKQNHQATQKPFQELMFLVRDWSDKKYAYGTSGGNTYLKIVMEPQLQHKDTQSVRKDVYESFERVTCCLMPHPGYEVSERIEEQGSDLKLSDVRDVFRETVDLLVRDIFSPQRVVAKTNNKKPVTGNDLINFTISYFEVFSSGKMPEVQTIMQATAKASMLMIIQECKDIYKKEMSEKCNAHLSEADLNGTHDISMRRALYAFDEERKLGDDAFIAKYRQNLEENLQQKFAEFLQVNKTRKEILKEEARDFMEEARNTYIASLASHIGDEYIDQQALENLDVKYHAEACNFFDSETAHLPEVADSYRQKLLGQLALELEKFTESNVHNLNQLMQQLIRNVQTACTNYREAMDEKTSEKILTADEFADAHILAHDKAVQEFDCAYVGRNILQKQEERNRLLKWINQLKFNYKNSNDSKRELTEKKKILEIMEEARKIFCTVEMESCDEGKFQEVLLEKKKSAEELTLSKGFLYWQHKTSFDEFIDNEFKEMKKRRADYKRRIEEKGKAVVKMAKAAYETYLKSSTGGNYVDEQTLRGAEEKSRERAITLYKQKTTNLPPQLIEVYFQKLENIITQQRKDFSQSNSEKLEKMLNDLTKQSDLSVRYYKQIMKSKCAEQIMSDKDFDEAHEEAQTDAVGTFDASSVGASTRQRKEAKDRLVLRLKEEHSSFKATNERNREQLQEKTMETLKAALIAYQSELKAVCSIGYVHQQSFEQANENSKKKAREVVLSVGDRNVVEKCTQLLDEMIDNEFQEAKTKNEEQMETEIKEKMDVAAEDHAALLKKAAGGKFVEEQLLAGLEQSSREESISQYKANTKKYPTNAVEAHQLKLENAMFQEWKRFKERNNHKFVEMKHQLDKELENAANKYKGMMEEACSNTIFTDEAFDANHQKTQKEAMRDFCNSKLGENTRLRNEEHKRLIETIQLTQGAFRKSNELKRREAEIEAMETLENATASYKLAIGDVCRDQYTEENILEKAHQDSRNTAEQIATAFNKKGFVQNYMSKFEEAISLEFKNIRNRNNDLKEAAINQFRQHKLDAYKHYQENVDSATQAYMEESKLQELHQSEMKKAMEEYTKGGSKKLKDDYESLRIGLEEEVTKHYQLACKRNKDLKWQLEEKGEKFLQEMKTAYMKIMDELCNGAYVEPALLQESHQSFKDEVKKKFTEYIGEDFPTIVNKFTERCCKELDDLLKDVEDQNKKNREVYLKKRRKKIGDILGGIGGLIGGVLGILAGPTGIKSGVDIGKTVGRWLGEHLAKLTETKG